MKQYSAFWMKVWWLLWMMKHISTYMVVLTDKTVGVLRTHDSYTKYFSTFWWGHKKTNSVVWCCQIMDRWSLFFFNEEIAETVTSPYYVDMLKNFIIPDDGTAKMMGQLVWNVVLTEWQQHTWLERQLRWFTACFPNRPSPISVISLGCLIPWTCLFVVIFVGDIKTTLMICKVYQNKSNNIQELKMSICYEITAVGIQMEWAITNFEERLQKIV